MWTSIAVPRIYYVCDVCLILSDDWPLRNSNWIVDSVYTFKVLK